MNFSSQWKEICNDTNDLLYDIAENGMTSSNSSNIKQTENEILELLSIIPSIFLKFQQSRDTSAAESARFVSDINKFRKQAELALTILNEFSTETSAVKMRNLIYTWNLLNEVMP